MNPYILAFIVRVVSSLDAGSFLFLFLSFLFSSWHLASEKYMRTQSVVKVRQWWSSFEDNGIKWEENNTKTEINRGKRLKNNNSTPRVLFLRNSSTPFT